MTERTEILDKVQSLISAGLMDEAIPLLHDAVQKGWVEAYVELASIERRRGNEAAAKKWISAVEDIASTGDAIATMNCYLAYQHALGQGSLDDQQRKANGHLRRAAELRNPVAQAMHANQLLWGLNGEVQDELEYGRWIAKAMEQNLPEAIISHV